ncbi:MAG: bacteriohemerythrin [Gemmatimonadales bacterium]|nr:bacteriohemerythrin [Gemmatimonadales bacterium]
MFGKNNLMRQLFFLVSLVTVGGSIGYTMIEEDWTLFDGFYMTLITLTTIGFSEVHELSVGGRVLTTVIIIFGLGSAATIFTQLAQMMMEGNVFAAWRKRRMDKVLGKMKDHVIICGYGRIGQAISRDLIGMGIPCVIIDRDEKKGDGAQALKVPNLSGNATSDTALLNAGVTRATILVAALSNDSDNLFVALAARDLNPNLVVIARGEDKSIETRMLRAGVDRVVYPSQLGGGQIARLIGAELGHETDENLMRRNTDVMGYDLQVYRNFRKQEITVQEILEITGAIRAIAHIDQEGQRQEDPGLEHEVGESEAVVILSEVGSTGPAEDDSADLLSHLGKSLSVGIPAIDEEHQQILTMIRRLNSAHPSNEREVGHEVLLELREYTARHFHHEERLFVSAGFPGAEEHIEEHRSLVAKVDQLLGDKEHLHRANLGHVLDDWIRHHIMEVDAKYAEFLQGVGAEK